jgi:hypothetical protein
MQKAEADRRQRLLLKNKTDEELKAALTAKPKYQAIEETYAQKKLLPEIKRREQELKKKRDLYAPIDHNQMEEHARRYQETQSELAAKRVADIEERRREMVRLEKSLPKHYKS